MNALLWTLQVLLALIFVAHGWMLLAPPPELLDAMNASMSTSFRLFLGGAEVLGGIGLLVPSLTRILPGLTPLAAAALLPIMIGAVVTHVQRGEVSATITTTVIAALLATVAYLRWKVRPLVPR